MSRSISLAMQMCSCFPRVSGDEPLKGKAIVSFDPFSPRERG